VFECGCGCGGDKILKFNGQGVWNLVGTFNDGGNKICKKNHDFTLVFKNISVFPLINRILKIFKMKENHLEKSNIFVKR
jgi:hypothetical protein